MKTDRQRRVAGHLRGVFGSRMTPGESDEPVATEGNIYIRKKTLKKILITILTKTSKTIASIKQKHDFQILKPSRGIE